MPPFPPIVHPEDPKESAQFVKWLGEQFRDGYYRLEVMNDFAPRIAREGGWTFQIGDKVFTIWQDAKP